MLSLEYGCIIIMLLTVNWMAMLNDQVSARVREERYRCAKVTNNVCKKNIAFDMYLFRCNCCKFHIAGLNDTLINQRRVVAEVLLCISTMELIV